MAAKKFPGESPRTPSFARFARILPLQTQHSGYATAAYHTDLQPTRDQSDDPDNEIEEQQDVMNEEYETEDDELSEDDNCSEFQTGEVGRKANFLIGQRSQYGRVVRLNNRLTH